MMGKLLAKVKSAFITETSSMDDGLFGAPDPLPIHEVVVREERPPNIQRTPASIPIGTYRTEALGANHNPWLSSLNVDISENRPPRNRLRPYGSDRYVPNTNSGDVVVERSRSPSPQIYDTSRRCRYVSSPEPYIKPFYGGPRSSLKRDDDLNSTNLLREHRLG